MGLRSMMQAHCSEQIETSITGHKGNNADSKLPVLILHLHKDDEYQTLEWCGQRPMQTFHAKGHMHRNIQVANQQS